MSEVDVDVAKRLAGGVLREVLRLTSHRLAGALLVEGGIRAAGVDARVLVRAGEGHRDGRVVPAVVVGVGGPDRRDARGDPVDHQRDAVGRFAFRVARLVHAPEADLVDAVAGEGERAVVALRLGVADRVHRLRRSGEAVVSGKRDLDRASVPAAAERLSHCDGRHGGRAVDPDAVHRGRGRVSGHVVHGCGGGAVFALTLDRDVGGRRAVQARERVGGGPCDHEVAAVPADAVRRGRGRAREDRRSHVDVDVRDAVRRRVAGGVGHAALGRLVLTLAERLRGGAVDRAREVVVAREADGDVRYVPAVGIRGPVDGRADRRRGLVERNERVVGRQLPRRLSVARPAILRFCDVLRDDPRGQQEAIPEAPSVRMNFTVTSLRRQSRPRWRPA